MEDTNAGGRDLHNIFVEFFNTTRMRSDRHKRPGEGLLPIGTWAKNGIA